MRHDRRRVFLIAGNELDFHPVGAEKIRKASIHCRCARCRWWGLTRLRLPTGGFLISRGGQLSRHRRNVRHREADVIEGGAAGGAGRLLHAQEDERVGKLNDIDAAELHCSAAEHVGPKLLMGCDARDVEVIVADADRCVRVTHELCERRRRHA